MKGKDMLVSIREQVEERIFLNYKRLEREHGILICLSKTYQNMSFYFKEIR